MKTTRECLIALINGRTLVTEDGTKAFINEVGAMNGMWNFSNPAKWYIEGTKKTYRLYKHWYIEGDELKSKNSMLLELYKKVPDGIRIVETELIKEIVVDEL